jgi:hypothetical protein
MILVTGRHSLPYRHGLANPLENQERDWPVEGRPLVTRMISEKWRRTLSKRSIARVRTWHAELDGVICAKGCGFSWQTIAASGLCSKACRVGSSSTNCGNREWYRISKNWIFLTSLRSRRLDDRIRELCAHAVAADNSPHMKSILSELQSAIHQYTQRLRARAAAILTGRNLAPDRRKTYRDRRKAA